MWFDAERVKTFAYVAWVNDKDSKERSTFQ
jgi:hypothetical protein